MNATLGDAANIMQGRLIGTDGSFRGVSTDTRSIGEGELFVALKGPNFDGSRFVGQALERSAAAAVVEDPVADTLPQIEVADTLRALGALAAHWRRQMPATVVGLTGSNGKTTLKEMVSACLTGVAETLATEGNLNNEIGVPLMLARLSTAHRYAVIEMGANHAGEIGRLTAMAMPDVVAITNAGPAHLEGFGSIRGVAVAKGEILSGDQRPHTAVLNADDDYYDYWCEQAADIDVISFGRSERANVRVTSAEPSGAGSSISLSIKDQSVGIALPIAGMHNASNAAAAAAICVSLGLGADAIKAGLESLRPVSGRLAPRPGMHGITLFDDSYNANPGSVKAAAEFLGAQAGTGWLVLGSMAELGEEAEALHREVGESARDAGVSRLYACGPLMRFAVDAFGAGGRWYDDVDALLEELVRDTASELPHSVLVKGSRSSRMERVVDALVATGEGN